MSRNSVLRLFLPAVLLSAAAGCLLLVPPASAQGPAASATAGVVMLSDIHFDPFRDPGKLDALRNAPASNWAGVLDEPDTSSQPEAFAALQTACKARGVDSSWAVLKSSLHAAQAQHPAPIFVTLSGDLLTHKFDCRMQTLAPSTTPEQLAAFAAKSLEFVALQLRAAFPGVAVYVALGNNDSGCTDYEQSMDSAFLRKATEVFVEGVFNQRHHPAVRPDFDNVGDYTAQLPRPVRRGRIIVLQNVWGTPGYKDCAGKASTAPAAAQNAWLREQLTAARSNHERVWVMAHVPPGVDEYASFHKIIATPAKLCDPAPLTMMLASDDLSATLAEFADVVRLAIFAHTHMDEIKSLSDGHGHDVPVKIVPSISPVNGNLPAFTRGSINPETATLMDYTVVAASDAAAASWAEAYSYGATYKQPDFSGKSVALLTAQLVADRTGDEDSSRAYQKWFFPGDTGPYAAGVKALWPTYSCGAAQTREAPFRQCLCPAAKDAAPEASTLH